MFYLRTHLTYFIYSYMVMDHLAEEETRCRHYMNYSFRVAARDRLYAPSTDRIAHTTQIRLHIPRSLVNQSNRMLDNGATPRYLIRQNNIIHINIFENKLFFKNRTSRTKTTEEKSYLS